MRACCLLLCLLLSPLAVGQEDYASPFPDTSADAPPSATQLAPSEDAPPPKSPPESPPESWPEDAVDDGPALFQSTSPPRTPSNRLPDVTADVLLPGEGQFNLFYLQYSRGLMPGLQVSAHFGGYLLTLVNLTTEYQFVNRPELRASVQVGAYYFALSQIASATLLQAHVMPRVTVPVGGDFEVNLAANARTLVMKLSGAALDNRDVRGEVSLLRYDPAGAWMLEARFPLLTLQSLSVNNVLGQANLAGSLLLDDLASWGVVLSRDFLIGDHAHVRLGVGYRNRPGIILIDSIGNFLFQFDVYWR